MTWSDVGRVLSHPAFAIGARIAAVFVIATLLTYALRRGVRKVQKRVMDETSPLRGLQRTSTLAKVIASAGIVAIWSMAGIYVLSGLGFDLAPLLAGVGIIGLAVGFGAQDLVKDVVSGFFILLEDQFGIGDVVQINAGASGKVEQLTLRVTGLRDLDGTVHFISNGSITHVANRSKDWSRAVLDIGVGYGEASGKVRSALERVAREANEDPVIGHMLHDVPEVQGVELLGEYEVVWRMVAETKPGRQWETGRALRERIKERLAAENIEIPFPHRVMISAGAESSD